MTNRSCLSRIPSQSLKSQGDGELERFSRKTISDGKKQHIVVGRASLKSIDGTASAESFNRLEPCELAATKPTSDSGA